MKLSFIVPYKHNSERLGLLGATINNLPKWNNIEICVSELGERPCFENTYVYKILSKFYNLKYCFNYYGGIFNRALAINIGAKSLATNKIFCLLDGDIVFKYQENTICDILTYGFQPCAGFNSMYFMNPEETKDYLIKGVYPSSHPSHKMRFSKPGGLAGGLIIMSKDIFMKIKGIPEMFKGTWGNDDNALWYKLQAYGYYFRSIPRCFYHLHHLHKTEKDADIMSKIDEIRNWTILDWKKYDNEIGNNWGIYDNKKYK
ncbi:MAG: galactosyltransferase-related protein [Candidatus Thorarchaeota archaeon]